MMNLNKNHKGFTLVEMLVSVAIFTVFTSILIGAYVYIIRDQRSANEYRAVYSQARRIFEVISDEVRNGEVYYPVEGELLYEPSYNGSNENLRIFDKSGDLSTIYFNPEEGAIFIEDSDKNKREIDEKFGMEFDGEEELDSVVVKEMDFYVSPVGDPYRLENVYLDAIQFQPKVTMVMKVGLVEDERSDVILRTTISSRIYK
ncbi:hypothetical protein CVV38_04235 [Candidatus Peregrinibacteria bacterium HGW-Peregrinibacteria-1]|jgi:prepilin-type N-terminal cleavage/methylation domain-containing protein|nr:MAG: hypothetical protein CVV38_04235 [Candidatus Peregrinibacteria bacterium HGW-Peregrinibacteria-1]